MAEEQGNKIGTPKDHIMGDTQGVVVAAIVPEYSDWENGPLVKDDPSARRDSEINRLLLTENTSNNMVLGKDIKLSVVLRGYGGAVEALVEKNQIPWMAKMGGTIKSWGLKIGSFLNIINDDDATILNDPWGIRGMMVTLTRTDGGEYRVKDFIDRDSNETQDYSSTGNA